MKNDEFFNKFRHIYNPILEFEHKCLPLCAAETEISDFVRAPLTSFVQEKYILGGITEYSSNNFIGSRHLFEIYGLLIELCKELFKCKYADGRTLTGVNTISTLLMSLFESGDTIYISSPEYGGHSSMPKICKRLGINTIDLPYNLEKMDFCYSEINRTINQKEIRGILICLSDIIFQPNLSQLDLSAGTILIYDATQVLGLIAANIIQNYFELFPQEYPFILAGSTHKTLPGPTNGLIMTNSSAIMKQIDLKINPDYLRNVQLHQILSLIFCLEEFSIYGKEYMNTVVSNANILGKILTAKGFDIIERNNIFTTTHQIFMHLPKEITHPFFMECQLHNISLNERYRKLYKGSGIRFGLQQVSRYGWGTGELQIISDIIEKIYKNCLNGTHEYSDIISMKINELAQAKRIKYTLSPEAYQMYYDYFNENNL